MTLAVVCPVIEPPETAPGWGAWDRDVLVIDNTGRGAWREVCAQKGWTHVSLGWNLGVAASWNLGVELSLDAGHDAVALISSSVVWDRGLSELDRLWPEYGDPTRGLLTDEAFHATIWAEDLLVAVGRFDENFWPAYYEDNDYVRRLELAGLHTGANPIPKAKTATRCENARALNAFLVEPDFGWLGRYYARKWGGMPATETFETPFGLPVDPAWWPVVRGQLPRWGDFLPPAPVPIDADPDWLDTITGTGE
jgi:hypothetical protein